MYRPKKYLVANAQKYSRAWKKSSIKNRNKNFEKITLLLQEINEAIACRSVKFGIRTEYAIEYFEQITKQYAQLFELHPKPDVSGKRTS